MFEGSKVNLEFHKCPRSCQAGILDYIITCAQLTTFSTIYQYVHNFVSSYLHLYNTPPDQCYGSSLWFLFSSMDNQRQFSLPHYRVCSLHVQVQFLPLLYTCYPQHIQAVYKYSQLPFGYPTWNTALFRKIWIRIFPT